VLKKPKPGGRRLKKPRPALETKFTGALLKKIRWFFDKERWKIYMLENSYEVSESVSAALHLESVRTPSSSACSTE
jgi:hypothetical protein